MGINWFSNAEACNTYLRSDENLSCQPFSGICNTPVNLYSNICGHFLDNLLKHSSEVIGGFTVFSKIILMKSSHPDTVNDKWQLEAAK